MQLISEVHHYMRHGLGLTHEEIHQWFVDQKQTRIASYLIDITAVITAQQDDLGTGYLLDKVSDRAGQKGTGRWCIDAALDLGVPVPTIFAAVTERQLSGRVDTRKELARGPVENGAGSQDDWSQELNDTLYGGMLCAFAQGLELIRTASETNGWGTDTHVALSLWRGGCIIRAAMLETLLNAEQLSDHIFCSPSIFTEVVNCRSGWERTVQGAQAAQLPMPAASASLAYLDSLRLDRLPTYMVQAQRDCFGAHTFERTDRDGVFHADWLAP